MSKRQHAEKSASVKPYTDETLYCERCGISFLWSSEEQTQRSRATASSDTGKTRANQPRPTHCPACRRLLPALARERGLVKWFSHKKRYGFLVRADQPDLFVHKSEIQPGVRLRPGDLVEFTVTENERGPAAAQVTLLQRAAAAP